MPPEFIPTPQPIEVSVVLPAKNEALNLMQLLPALFAHLAEHSQRFEVVVVDDGSTDETRSVLVQQIDAWPQLRYVRLARNFGKELAIAAGLNAARGRAVIVMDSDGQHPPALIADLLAHWRGGAEMVYTVQTDRREALITRALKQWFYRILERASGTVIPANAGDYRLLDRKLVDVLNAMPERNRFMKGLYGWPGFRSVGIPLQVNDRQNGKSNYSLIHLAWLAVTGLTAFSMTPLRAVTFVGGVVSFAAFAFGLSIVFEYYVEGVSVPGFATLAVGMTFLSGIQLLAIGVLAEYLGRVFEEVKQRPLYVVAEELSTFARDEGASEAPKPATLHRWRPRAPAQRRSRHRGPLGR